MKKNCSIIGTLTKRPDDNYPRDEFFFLDDFVSYHIHSNSKKCYVAKISKDIELFNYCPFCGAKLPRMVTYKKFLQDQVEKINADENYKIPELNFHLK